MRMEDWNEWHEVDGARYPHEKVIQFCFRAYPPDRRENVRALDLGCGSGINTVFLATEGFRVTGVDFSPVAIRNARQRLDRLGLQGPLLKQEIDRLDLEPASFDLVICVGVFDSTGPEVAKKSVDRLSRIMSRGARGLFLFASNRDFRVPGDPPYNLHGYNEAEVEDLFSGDFEEVWMDRYITTYENGRIEQNDWLITIRR